MKSAIIQVLKFHFVGISNVILTYGIYSLLLYLIGSHRIALICDYVFGIVYTFLCNKYFTFKKSRSGRGLQEFLRILLLYIVVFALNWNLLNFFVESLHWNKYLAQLISLSAVTSLSFLGQKFLVFREKAIRREKS